MKKIFAIALALVMVLSMASAFATLQCDPKWDWAGTTYTYDCGTAQIFVDEYVRANTACGYDLVANSCAAPSRASAYTMLYVWLFLRTSTRIGILKLSKIA